MRADQAASHTAAQAYNAARAHSGPAAHPPALNCTPHRKATPMFRMQHATIRPASLVLLGTAAVLNMTGPAQADPTATTSQRAATSVDRDRYGDVAILHQVGGNGIDVHLVRGGTTPFQNRTTYVRGLPASAKWDWTKIKPAVGDYNGDGSQDVALVHQVAGDGADIHVLQGGAQPFANRATFQRQLPARDGWRWTRFAIPQAAGPAS